MSPVLGACTLITSTPLRLKGVRQAGGPSYKVSSHVAPPGFPKSVDGATSILINNAGHPIAPWGLCVLRGLRVVVDLGTSSPA